MKATRKSTSRGIGLNELLQIQTDFQTAYFPIRNIPLSSLASAVACEAMEIWAASGKWWYKNNRENLDNIKEESIDILHFLLMLWLKLDMNENQIADLYRKKMRVNIQRQIEDNTRTL